MDIIKKELQSRRGEIRKSLKMLFETNMKITDWDIPEADDKKAAQMLTDIIQEELDELKSAIKNGKYDNY